MQAESSKEHSERIHSPAFRAGCTATAFKTVAHKEEGVLCQGARCFEGWTWEPIRWRSSAAAWRWIQSGSLAEIQEGLGNLVVQFVKMQPTRPVNDGR